MSLTGDDNMRSMQTSYNTNFDSSNTTNLTSPTQGRGIHNHNQNSDPGLTGSTKPKLPKISYRECLKNHAASMGGTVTDGCGEFMPSGEEGTLEALKCAACSCHRNFHRRETLTPTPHHHYLALPPPLPSPSVVQPMKIAFGAGGGGGGSSVGTESSSEELNFPGYGQHQHQHNNNNNNNNNNNQSSAVVAAPPPPHFSSSGKKRFRTKFTAEQKEKMMAFAEKLGWRIPREDDSEMQRFCGEVGVKRQVFKVWMHNNKITSSGTGGGGGGAGGAGGGATTPTSNPKKMAATDLPF